MLKELKTIFESVDKDILSEDTLNAISTLVNEKVEEKVNDRVTLEVESAVKLQNDKFKKVTQEALNRIDKDHTNKAKMAVKIIREDADKKLLTVHNRYKKLIAETAVKHRDSLVDSIDEFLDLYVEKSIPTAQIEEAAKNKYALKAVEEARKILGVDESYITNNIRKAVVDGKEKMDKLLQENRELKKRKIVSESRNTLESKIKNLPIGAAKFVKERLQNKSAQFINENFDYVVDMYKRQEQTEKRSALLNEKRDFNVDRNRVADELNKKPETSQPHAVNPNNPMENLYMEGLNFKK